MRIGVHLQALRPGLIGGMEAYVRNLVDWLPRVDADLELLLFCADYNSSSFTPNPQVRVVELSAAEFAGLDRQTLATHRLDLWFCPLLALEPKDPGLPCAVTIPDLQHESFPEFFSHDVLRWRRESYRHTVDKADLLLTLSEYSKRELVHVLQADPGKVAAIPIDASEVFTSAASGDRARARYDLPATYFFYPANPWPHKNHKLLFEALAGLRGNGTAPPALVLTGAHRDGSSGTDELERHHQRLLDAQRRAGLTDRVRHLGYVRQEDLPDLYREAVALVHPSLFEGFGLPVLEALRVGCPVLSSSATSLPEVGGDAAIYFDPQSHTDLRDKMCTMLDGWNRGSDRARLIENGKRQASRFSWQRTAEETRRRFRTLLETEMALETGITAIAPKLSIIMPSLDQAPFLESALRSVLGQGRSDVELIVIDGGSTDGSVEIIEKYRRLYPDRLRYVSEPDNGQAHAVNKGLARARGTLVGWLNSDDVYEPGGLDCVIRAFEEQPNCDVVYGRANYIDRHGTVTEPYPVRTTLDRSSLAHECYLCQPAVFWRRRADESDWRLDESLQLCMDYDLWIRMAGRCQAYFLDRVVAGSRMYAENKTMSRRSEVFCEIFRTVRHHYGFVPLSWTLGRAHFLVDHEDSPLPSQQNGHRVDLPSGTLIFALAAFFSLRNRGLGQGDLRRLVGKAWQALRDRWPALSSGPETTPFTVIEGDGWTESRAQLTLPANWREVEISFLLPEGEPLSANIRFDLEGQPMRSVHYGLPGYYRETLRLPGPPGESSPHHVGLHCDRSLPPEPERGETRSLSLRLLSVRPTAFWT